MACGCKKGASSGGVYDQVSLLKYSVMSRDLYLVTMPEPLPSCIAIMLPQIASYRQVNVGLILGVRRCRVPYSIVGARPIQLVITVPGHLVAKMNVTKNTFWIMFSESAHLSTFKLIILW